MMYFLWVGAEEVMNSTSIERLQIEIENEYEDYDDAVIVDENGQVVYRNEV